MTEKCFSLTSNISNECKTANKTQRKSTEEQGVSLSKELKQHHMPHAKKSHCSMAQSAWVRLVCPVPYSNTWVGIT